MTLAEIMRLALRQLDEDPADIGDFSDLFRQYANEGYHIAVTQHYHPREVVVLETDENGDVRIDETNIERVVSLSNEYGQGVPYVLSLDGKKITTNKKEASLSAVVEVSYPPLTADTDKPLIPEYAHMALVDYVCYRQLSIGNAAKQSRAMMFYQQFNRAMNELEPQAKGSTTRFRNLYAATDIRRRW